MFLLFESLCLSVIGHGLGTGSHVFQDGLKQYIVEDNLEFLPLLPPTGITGMCHRAWSMLYRNGTVGFVYTRQEYYQLNASSSLDFLCLY